MTTSTKSENDQIAELIGEVDKELRDLKKKAFNRGYWSGFFFGLLTIAVYCVLKAWIN